MKTKCNIMFLAALFCVGLWTHASFAESEVARPSNLSLTPPEATVPKQCARFFSELGWGRGKWGGVRDTELWVEQINPDCSAVVVTAWGWHGNKPPGYRRVKDAKIKDGKLKFTVQYTRSSATITASFGSNDDELRLDWHPLTGSAKPTKAELKRGADYPPRFAAL